MIIALVDMRRHAVQLMYFAIDAVVQDQAPQIELQVARHEHQRASQIIEACAAIVRTELVLIRPPATVFVTRQFDFLQRALDLEHDRRHFQDTAPEIELDRQVIDEQRLAAVFQRNRDVLDPHDRVEAVHVAAETGKHDVGGFVPGQQVLDLGLEILDVDHRQAQTPERHREQNDRGSTESEQKSSDGPHQVVPAGSDGHHVIGLLRKMGFHL